MREPKFFEASEGKTFVDQIIPEVGALLSVHHFGRGIAIAVAVATSVQSSGDSVGTEWYYCVPVAARTYKRARKEGEDAGGM